MSNNIFQDIESLYSQWSLRDNVARLGYLTGEWNRLNQLAYQYGMYLRNRVGITQAERQYAQNLMEMLNSVEAESAKAKNDLNNEVLKEFTKVLSSVLRPRKEAWIYGVAFPNGGNVK